MSEASAGRLTPRNSKTIFATLRKLTLKELIHRRTSLRAARDLGDEERTKTLQAERRRARPLGEQLGSVLRGRQDSGEGQDEKQQLVLKLRAQAVGSRSGTDSIPDACVFRDSEGPQVDSPIGALFHF